MGLIWTDELPGAPPPRSIFGGLVGTPSGSSPSPSIVPSIFLSTGRQAALQGGDDDDDMQPRILGTGQESKLSKAHVFMERIAPGDDAFMHDRTFKADLTKLHTDAKALFHNPRAASDRRLGLIDIHHDHSLGKLAYSGKRLGQIRPPTTAEQLEALIRRIGVFAHLAHVDVELDIKITKMLVI
ncbi:hypothetical protein JCM21900_001272, partial [Sporobolomyces salmonicolor]